jgi:hypothetical protein
MAPRAPVSPVEAACILLVRHTQHGHAVVHDASQDDCSRRTLSHSTCHKCTCMEYVTRPCAVPNSIHERGLSVSDLGQTCEGMRKKWSVGRPKTLHEIVWWPHLAAPGVSVIRERSPLKMCGTSKVSCHGLGDPVRCRPLLDGPWAGMGIMPCCLSYGPHRGEIP